MNDMCWVISEAVFGHYIIINIRILGSMYVEELSDGGWAIRGMDQIHRNYTDVAMTFSSKEDATRVCKEITRRMLRGDNAIDLDQLLVDHMIQIT